MQEDEHPFPWRRELTAELARATLAEPLRFGDASQIEAKRYIEALEAARLRLLHCKQCGGEGIRYSRRRRDENICPCIAGEAPQILRELGIGVKSRPYLVG